MQSTHIFFFFFLIPLCQYCKLVLFDKYLFSVLLQQKVKIILFYFPETTLITIGTFYWFKLIHRLKSFIFFYFSKINMSLQPHCLHQDSPYQHINKKQVHLLFLSLLSYTLKGVIFFIFFLFLFFVLTES